MQLLYQHLNLLLNAGENPVCLMYCNKNDAFDRNQYDQIFDISQITSVRIKLQICPLSIVDCFFEDVESCEYIPEE